MSDSVRESSRERPWQSPFRTIGETCCFLLVVYVLSPGPLFWLAESDLWGDFLWRLNDIFQMIYAPLVWLYDNVEFVEKFYDWSVEPFGNP